MGETKKQIKLYHIMKIQNATVRLFEAEDDDYPGLSCCSCK